MEEHQGQPTGVWMDLDGCFARRLVLFGVEVDLDGASIERHTPHKGEGGGRGDAPVDHPRHHPTFGT